MNRNLKKLLAACMVLVLALAMLPIAAMAEEEEYIRAYFYLDEYEIQLHLGDTYQVEPHIYYPADVVPEYEAEHGVNYGAVTVDENGLITATEVGEALVWVTVGDSRACLIVTILDEIPDPASVPTPLQSIRILWEYYDAELDDFEIVDAEEIHVPWGTDYEYINLFAPMGGSGDKLVWEYTLRGDPYGCYLMHNYLEWEHSSNNGNYCDFHIYGDAHATAPAPKEAVVLTVTVTTSAGATDSLDVIFDPPADAEAVYEIVERRATCTEEGGTFAVYGDLEYTLYRRPVETAHCSTEDFVDVPAVGNWAHAGIDYVVGNGLMGGTDATHFEPGTSVSRAMLVTTLWRAAGSPQVEYRGNFSDVKDGKYYTTAVAWAAELGIVRGDSSGRFNPADNVTRQDLANVLYQYAVVKGVDTSERYNLGSFSDGKDVSTYAKDAMSWMLAKDILRGADGKITPKDTATRAQFALILMNFIELTK